MALTVHKIDDAGLIEVRVSGKLTSEDYQTFVPEIETAIQKNGKISILFHMKDFHGWQAGALWEDLKFDWKHFADIKRLAMVGDKQWEKGMAVFCKPFTTANIRFFPPEQLDDAQRWLREETESK